MARDVKFQNEYYYHICNRGVDKRKVFLDQWDYIRFLKSLREFNRVKPIGSLHHLNKTRERDPISPAGEIGSLLDIIAYCLNSNHYHLLVRQKKNKGISEFMKRLGIGYTKYFNEKYNRSGSLFQGKYKFTEIISTHDLIKVSIYINCNAEIHNIAKKENWIWSSYLDYTNLRNGDLCNKKEVLSEFNDIMDYKRFCEELIPEIQEGKILKKYNLE